MSGISFSSLRRLLLKGALAAVAGLAGAAVLVAPVFAQDKPEIIRIGSTAPGHLKFILAQQD
ncbi:MAG: aliphatic sulfonates ABC transporter substrate-binding protein, partial [Mesorhizobium sp.]